LPRLGPAYEEILQDIFAIGSGEQLFAIFAMQRPIAGAGFRLHAHDLIACLAPGTDEIGGIVFDHTKVGDMPFRLRFPLEQKQKLQASRKFLYANLMRVLKTRMPKKLSFGAAIRTSLPMMGLRVFISRFLGAPCTDQSDLP
jgi:hypothetical protein